MANVFVEETTLTAIADSIRAKTGTTDKIYPADMATAIEGITGGGGGEGVPDGYVTVTFMSGDTVLFTRLVLKGDDCPDPWVQKRIDTPTKESTVQYDYTFNGWATADGGTADSTALQNITEDKVLYAAFAESVRMYTVTYYDEDGVTLLYTEQVPYGSMPSYVPEGAGFAGWTPDTPVTGDTSYTAVWSSVLASGSCGGKTTYTLTSDYVLTISGTGYIRNSQNTSKSDIVPEEFVPLVKTLVIEDGVTSIGDYTFKKMTGLTSVFIANTVTKIGQQCFNGCSSLVNINLPSGLTSIANRAFVLCTSLTSITIPSAVTCFYERALYGCSALTSIKIPSAVKTIYANVFDDCTALASAIFEDTEGWTAGTTALASSDLADTAKAATYLRSTYRSKTWTKS